jgi:hypothetical protein
MQIKVLKQNFSKTYIKMKIWKKTLDKNNCNKSPFFKNQWILATTAEFHKSEKMFKTTKWYNQMEIKTKQSAHISKEMYLKM